MRTTLIKYFIGAALVLTLFGASATYAAPFLSAVGGTGTTTPSGILYGDNGTTNHLNTVNIGSNLTFSGGTLSATGGGSGSGTVSTSTVPSVGQLPYWTSNGFPSLLGSVATTSLTATSPLSLSNPISVIGGSASALTINTSGAWTGNAGTATALAANGTNCSAGSFALGIDASGNAEGCTVATTGTVTAVSIATVAGVSGSSSGGATPALTITLGALTGVTSVNGLVVTSNTGVITTGTWNGTTIATVNGGTGATSFSGQSIITSNAAGTALLATSSLPLWVGALTATTTTATSTFNGNVKIASTSPNTLIVQDQYGTNALTVNTASTTGPILTVQATSTTDTLFSVDQYGHLTASSTPNSPVLSSCGSSPTLGTNSNDVVGSINAGSGGITACTLTFGRAYSATPIVVVSDNSTTAVTDVSAISTTAFTVSFASSLTSPVIYYFVIMP